MISVKSDPILYLLSLVNEIKLTLEGYTSAVNFFQD